MSHIWLVESMLLHSRLVVLKLKDLGFTVELIADMEELERRIKTGSSWPRHILCSSRFTRGTAATVHGKYADVLTPAEVTFVVLEWPGDYLREFEVMYFADAEVNVVRLDCEYDQFPELLGCVLGITSAQLPPSHT